MLAKQHPRVFWLNRSKHLYAPLDEALFPHGVSWLFDILRVIQALNSFNCMKHVATIYHEHAHLCFLKWKAYMLMSTGGDR
jgi:hypothetical protein